MPKAQTRGGVSPRVSPFADVRDLGGLLQRAGFALPVADVERLMVRYRDFSALVRDLRAHGFTNVMSERSRQLLAPRHAGGAAGALCAAIMPIGRQLRARFETLYLTGWAPHESQQQPLKPGSAKTRLAEALGTAEQLIKENSYGCRSHGARTRWTSLVPTVVTAVMITSAIRPAISAYSMAVAPPAVGGKFFTRDRAAWE